MKILLLKSPRSYLSHFTENSESLALGYLAAVLRKSGFTVSILDASLHGVSTQDTIKAILHDNYELIGFTIADPTFIESSIEIINELRKHNVTAHITMGGHTPTFHYENILNMCEGLNSIVMNEGELTIVALATLLKKKVDWKKIKGIACRTISGIVCNPSRELIQNLDSLPFPERDTLPLVFTRENGYVSVAGGRGCPMNCGFCSIRAFYSVCDGPSWRVRSINNIIDEIEYLSKNFGVQEIVMVDDIFVGPGKRNRERAFEFANEIKKRNIRIMMSIAERVDNIDTILFERLKEVGVRNVLIGIEAGNQQMLDYFSKGIVLKDIEAAVAILKRLNIGITASFINFTPETTIKQLKNDLQFYGKLEINILQGLLNRFQYYKGTPLGEKLRKENRVMGEFPEYMCLSVDERVNRVFDIAQRSLGNCLAMANKLNTISRRLRFKAFKAEFDDPKILSVLENETFIYNKCVNSINKDALKLLSEILDYVSVGINLSNNEIDNYCHSMEETSSKKYQEWDKMLYAFEMLTCAK